jgi:signal transduction histidine kinase
VIQRLHTRIYLTTLGSLAFVVILCALLWRYSAEPSGEAQQDRFVAALMAKALPSQERPHDLQIALDELLVPPIEGLTLLDSDGSRIASAGAMPDRGDSRNRHAMTDPTASWSRVIVLDDGRMLVVRTASDSVQFHLRGLALIALVALAVALGTWPIVRRLTRRVERLAQAVDHFGRGDLSARARVMGQDEISRLASSFNAMADRVGSLLAAHSRMLANASHELRSPLARIRMALELHANDPREDLLHGMRRDCAEIDEQIEEILLASKLDTVDTAPPTDAVDLEVLLAEECSRLDIAFTTVPAEVTGDARLLRRLIRNLLENALKYGGSGTEATLAINEQGCRILQVSDRGPGIPEAERERIFEPFYRPANTAETGNGWGLGLALVRQIADRHRGSVRCLARVGGGCVFELTLPAPVRAREH